MKPVEPSVPFGVRRVEKIRQSGFAMAEAVIGAGLVAMMISCLFATNAHLMGMLRQGKQSAFATQLIGERVEQLRTVPWLKLTTTTGLQGMIDNGGNPATSANLPQVTETFTIQPYPNPTNVQIQCTKPGSGTSSVTGTNFDPSVDTVKVVVNIKWKTGKRQREREFATVMQYAGI